ncbi:hypothetical protein [Treponema sp.]|uniref:hypothetical protein n=1 Tax=Treponema sp. TaxID=166 RepID=UPI00298E372E|nr:hypothetical protein [Treponema sp.]MCQ2240359.1 hypothetical protein [Treponema sp.]
MRRTLNVVTALIFSLLFIFTSCTYKVQPSVLALNGENFSALNRSAVKSKADGKKNKFLCYGFSKNQIAHFKNAVYKYSGASLSIQIDFDTKSKNKLSEYPYALGFLYEEDKALIGNDEIKLLNRPLFKGDYLDCQKGKFKISYSVSTTQDIPCGFFVYTTKSATVSEFRISEAKIGWDNSADIPLFACGAEGGRVIWNFSSADLSSAKNIFPSENAVKKVMPKIEVGLFPLEDNGTWKKQTAVGLEINGEKIDVRLQKNQKSVLIQTAALRKGYSEIHAIDHPELVSSMMIKANSPNLVKNNFSKVLVPIKTDLGLVMDWPQDNWRIDDYELYEWYQFPNVLFFDFADYKIQNQFFTRLAYFVEKAGYKGTLVGNDFVENKHGYNAHDYKPEDLAAFFTTVELQEFPINDREHLLREILETNKIIIRNDDGTYSPGKGAVISFSRESPRYLRYTFLAHESWHGIYFIDDDFRNVVSACYNMFDSDSMEFLKTFWETQPGLGYDRSDEYLMQNEFMAYIMQQTFPNIAPYFLQVAGRGSVNRIQPEGAEYIRNTKAQAFVDAGEVLNDYAFEKWGLACGRVSLIIRD